MLPVRLKSDAGVPITSVRVARDELVGAATFPAYRERFYPVRLQNDVGSYDLAIQASPGGVNFVIWNGTQDAGGDWDLWGSTAFESASAAHSGVTGVDSGSLRDNRTFGFSTSPRVPLPSGGTLSFWIKPVSRGSDSQLRVRFEGSDNYSYVDIVDYIGAYQVGTWQHVVIPLSDMNVSGNVDELQFRADNSRQRHYIDDVQVNDPTGVPTIFRSGCNGGACRLERLELVLASQNTGWKAGDFADLDGGLSAGVLVRLRDRVTGGVDWAFNVLTNMDLFGLLSADGDATFLDGEFLVSFSMDFSPYWEVLSKRRSVELFVRDNLSSLLRFEAIAHLGRLPSRFCADAFVSGEQDG